MDITSEGRIQLREFQLDCCQLGETLLQSIQNPSCHMFYQLGRDIHLLFYNRIDGRIVDRIVQFVTLHSLLQWSRKNQIHNEIVPHLRCLLYTSDAADE